jgi:hypothetical protein
MKELQDKLNALFGILPADATGASLTWMADGKSHNLGLSSTAGMVSISYSFYTPTPIIAPAPEEENKKAA